VVPRFWVFATGVIGTTLRVGPFRIVSINAANRSRTSASSIGVTLINARCAFDLVTEDAFSDVVAPRSALRFSFVPSVGALQHRVVEQHLSHLLLA
jgi:hypothetical protein